MDMSRTLLSHIAFRRLILLLLIVGSLYIWWSARYQFAHMDSFFIRNSTSGYQGLAYYLMNLQGKAAAAYRAHFKSHDLDRTRLASSPAERALLSGDIQLAKNLADQALQANANDLKALLDLIDIAISEHNYPAGHRYVEDVLRTRKDQPDGLLALALISAKTGKYDDSITSLTSLLRSDTAPFRTSAFLTCMETISDLSSLPRQDVPNNVVALLYRYLRIFDPSNGRPAIAFAQQAIVQGNRPEDAYLTIGMIHKKEGRGRKALESFNAAIAMNPRYALSHWYTSKAYGELGDLANEFSMIKTTLQLAPHEEFYIRDLGHVVMEKNGDALQAIALFEQALTVNPDNSMARHWLGHAYNFTGKYQRADSHYRQAITLDPANPVLYEGLADSVQHQDKIEEAIALLKHAAAIAPSRVESRQLLGDLLYEQSRKAEAIPVLEEAHRLLPHEPPSAKLCHAYYVQAMPQQAVSCYRANLQKHPNTPGLLKMLREAELNLSTATVR